MSDGYKDVAHIYQAMVPAQTLLGETTANPFMAQKLASLPNDACVLDAACGAGWDIIAVRNGIPSVAKETKRFNVSASDGSVYMVEQARKNETERRNGHGYKPIDIRHCMLSQLVSQTDWLGRFDAIIVPNAINQLHGGMGYADYDSYLIESFRGIKPILKSDGAVLVDSRDWNKTVQAKFAVTHRINQHKDHTYMAEYIWTFGSKVDGPHSAEMTIWNNTNKEGAGFKELIRFAGKSPDNLQALFKEAGFSVVNTWQQVRGVCKEPFLTFELRLG